MANKETNTMNGITANLIRQNRDHMEREARYCRQAQSWAPHAVRSAWFPEVEDVIDAIDRGAPDAEIEQLAAKAIDRARELAEKVIRERIIPGAEEDLRNALADVGVEDTDNLTLSDLIALCRQHQVTVDQTHSADGILVTEREATAFAVQRPFLAADEDEPEWVVLPMLDEVPAR